VSRHPQDPFSPFRELESEGKTRACWDKTSHEFILLKTWRACCSSHGLQISLQHMSLTRGGNKTLADDEISNTPCTFHTMEQHMNHAQNSEWHAPNHFNQVMFNSQLFPLQRCKERWSTTKLELASEVCKNKICEQNPTETWILSLHGNQRLWKKQTTKSFSTEMHHSTLSLCFGT